jgi:hypothetical protein
VPAGSAARIHHTAHWVATHGLDFEALLQVCRSADPPRGLHPLD